MSTSSEQRMIERAGTYAEQRTGASALLSKMLRYVFPDHWSFLIGEIALYAFVVLIGTGIYLALFFHPSTADVTYTGSYSPLHGAQVSDAYDSALRLSFDVKAGLLMRQTHHWAALVFVGAIVCHLLRIFFTGAFRKPRDINYYIGLTMLTLALVEGFAGYSLIDDLLSGMGLAIANGVTLSIPVIGGDLGSLIWGGPFPGSADFLGRLFIAHVLLLPVVIGALITIHLGLIALPHHTQFRGRRKREDNVVGTPMWPGYALRAVGLLLATSAVLFALGGLVQVNPIWQWGPFETFRATNGAQPDWYMGWLIGALRIMPNFEPVIGNYTLAGNPFFGGVLLPGIVFTLLYAWPMIEHRISGDRESHHLLQRPRDNPGRTAIGAAMLSFILLIFLAGAADRLFVSFGIPYTAQVWVFRVAVFIVPPTVFWVTRRVCRELQGSGWHPLRSGRSQVVTRSDSGGFERLP